MLTGLPIGMQSPKRLIKRFGKVGRVLAVTQHKARALISFPDRESVGSMLVDGSLRLAGVAVQAIQVAEACSSSGGHHPAVRTMALEHQEKLTDALGALATVCTRSSPFCCQQC